MFMNTKEILVVFLGSSLFVRIQRTYGIAHAIDILSIFGDKRKLLVQPPVDSVPSANNKFEEFW